MPDESVKTRSFKGRAYRLESTHGSEDEAQKAAKALRDERMLVRVIRMPVWYAMSGNGWGVYATEDKRLTGKDETVKIRRRTGTTQDMYFGQDENTYIVAGTMLSGDKFRFECTGPEYIVDIGIHRISGNLDTDELAESNSNGRLRWHDVLGKHVQFNEFIEGQFKFEYDETLLRLPVLQDVIAEAEDDIKSLLEQLQYEKQRLAEYKETGSVQGASIRQDVAIIRSSVSRAIHAVHEIEDEKP